MQSIGRNSVRIPISCPFRSLSLKQPVSVTVKVLGTSGSGTVEATTATVRINWQELWGFDKSCRIHIYCARRCGQHRFGDAISAALAANGCTFDGDGYLLRSVTDVNGVTLSVVTVTVTLRMVLQAER